MRRARTSIAIGIALGLAVVIVTVIGCLKTASFSCTDSSDCVRGGGGGVCEPTGFCSFDDATCEGGRRYGDLSGSLAGQCVGGEVAPDAPPMPDSPDAAPNCFGSGVAQVCPDVQPTQVVTLSGALNTDTSPMCVSFTSPNNTVGCVVAGHSITIDASFTATGTKPLVLVSSTTITIGIAGVLDVSSRRNPLAIGAGADSALCTAGTNPTQGGTGGGAWGGSFNGKGGDGGAGLTPSAGGIAAAASATPSVLRGGCAGGTGAGVNGGIGGHGGGAVFLIARQQIQVAGTINASGASGTGAGASADQAGGGGGGSGGMIGFEAPMIAITGVVFANGGGGGEGGGTTIVGFDGLESTAPATVGLGGVNPTPGAGGDGGNGSVAATLNGLAGGPDDTDGGGGGGGGAGVIRIFTTQLTNTGSVAPPPT